MLKFKMQTLAFLIEGGGLDLSDFYPCIFHDIALRKGLKNQSQKNFWRQVDFLPPDLYNRVDSF